MCVFINLGGKKRKGEQPLIQLPCPGGYCLGSEYKDPRSGAGGGVEGPMYSEVSYHVVQ